MDYEDLRVLDMRWVSRRAGISQECGHSLGGGQVFGRIKEC